MAAELAPLVARLEAVTARLEAVQTGGRGGGGGASPGELMPWTGDYFWQFIILLMLPGFSWGILCFGGGS